MAGRLHFAGLVGSATTCSHCGKECAELKRCSVCKQASYCGAACQNAAWKKHKKKCEPPLSAKEMAAKLEAPAQSPYEVMDDIEAQLVAENWKGVLAWEWRLEKLLAVLPDADCAHILLMFEPTP